MGGLRRFKALPVHVVEDHNEALPFLFRCMGSRHLPLAGNVLVHLDSHPDLLLDHTMPAELVRDKEKLFERLSIENWILPACYGGHFTTVYWVKPSWCEQLPAGSHSVLVGRHRATGTIRVHSDLYYFLSDGLVVDEAELDNVTALQLCVVSEDELPSFADLGDRHLVLDIDLDYFSTQNPFLGMFSAGGLYDKLRALFAFPVPRDLRLDSGQPLGGEQMAGVVGLARARRQQLDLLDTAFKALQEGGAAPALPDMPETMAVALAGVTGAVAAHYAAAEDGFDWAILHNAGLTCDRTELPHHVATERELSAAFARLRATLARLGRPPTVVTVARSSLDEYCPPVQVQAIQDQVLDLLGDRFGQLAIRLEYDT